MSNRNDYALQSIQFCKRPELKVILMRKLAWIDHWIIQQGFNSKLSELIGDIWHPAITSVFHILFKSDSKYTNTRPFKLKPSVNHELHCSLCNEFPHIVVDTSTCKYYLWMIA